MREKTKNPDWFHFMMIVCGLLAMGALLTRAMRADSLTEAEILADHFDNGESADSDQVAGFWRVEPDKQARCRLTENQDGNGRFELSLSNAQPGVSPKFVLRSETSSDFNFATGQLTISVRGIQVRTEGPQPKPWDSVLRFSLTSRSAHPWASSDAITLVLVDSGPVLLCWKTDKPQADPIQTKAETIDVKARKLGAIVGFDLTLNPTGYKVVLHGSEKQITVQGLYADKGGLTPWGNSALVIDFQRCTTVDGVTSHFRLDDLTVMRSRS